MKKVIVFLVSVSALVLGVISAFDLAERAKEDLGKGIYEHLPDESISETVTYSDLPASKISSVNKEQNSGMEELIIDPVIENSNQQHRKTHSLPAVQYSTNPKSSFVNAQFDNIKEKPNRRPTDISSGGMLLAYGKASRQNEGSSAGGHIIFSTFDPSLKNQLYIQAEPLQEYIDPDNTYWETPPKTLPIPDSLFCFSVFILVFIAYKKIHC